VKRAIWLLSASLALVAAPALAAESSAPKSHAAAAASAAPKAAAAPSTTAAAEAPPAPVAAPAAAPAPAPAASAAPKAASPAWLRTDKPVAKRPLELQQGPSPLRVGGMLLLVACLGGVAWYARKKRQGATPAAQKPGLRVLGTTRVGAKASAVVVEVSGKRLLLGVTDQNVSTLAWLDDEANAAVDDEREADGLGERAPRGAYAPDDVAAEGPSGFLRVLRNAVGSAAVAPPLAAERVPTRGAGARAAAGGRKPAAVDELVRATRDEVRISRREPEQPIAFEGQVMGLAKRRKESP
jgi:flagellar biosynthetic protein FliO